MELDALAKMQTLQDQYLAEADPNKQRSLANHILTLGKKRQKTGRSPPVKNRLILQTRCLEQPSGRMQINLKDPNQVIELGGQSKGANDPVMSIIEGNPLYLKAFNAADQKRSRK